MEKKEIELVDFVVTARKYKTTLTRKFMNRKEWIKPIEGEVKAILPGTVLEIAVKVGDEVKKGDLLLIHEAMKMRNRIKSPINGRVAEIRVEAGLRVTKDTVMVVIE
ncbi:MAG: biotin/lipoyl-containing protein [Bacteroidales bacterium]